MVRAVRSRILAVVSRGRRLLVRNRSVDIWRALGCGVGAGSPGRVWTWAGGFDKGDEGPRKRRTRNRCYSWRRMMSTWLLKVAGPPCILEGGI